MDRHGLGHHVTATIVEALPFAAAGVAASVTTASGTLATDLLLMIRASEDDGSTNWADPTISSGGGTPSKAHSVYTTTETSLEWWACTLTTAGAKTFTSNHNGGSRNDGYVLVLRGQNSSWDDGFNGAGTETNMTSYQVPSVSPVGSDNLLFGAWVHRTAAGSGLTLPASFTTRYNSGILALGVETLSASGPTGTRTATGANDGWCGTLLSVRGDGGSSPPAGKGLFMGLMGAGF